MKNYRQFHLPNFRILAFRYNDIKCNSRCSVADNTYFGSPIGRSFCQRLFINQTPYARSSGINCLPKHQFSIKMLNTSGSEDIIVIEVYMRVHYLYWQKFPHTTLQYPHETAAYNLKPIVSVLRNESIFIRSVTAERHAFGVFIKK